MLADIAIKIQLSRTAHDLAVSRYNTVAAHIDRPDSPLHDLIDLFYAQGSMAIGATIAARLDNDEFDIDVVIQLILALNTPPAVVLDLLYKAVRGKADSRYYKMTQRNTRCVTVHYKGMHLDLTPALLLPERAPRTSYIFHSKLEEPREFDQRIIANPYGFAEWYKQSTPADARFAQAFAERAYRWDKGILAEADIEDVPSPDPLYLKSPATVALQLIKRWRNVQYDKRDIRKPPSVLLAKQIAESDSGSIDLVNELTFQVAKLSKCFQTCIAEGRLLHVHNPRCYEDVLTDRWPATMQDQQLFATDLKRFERQLTRLKESVDLKTIRRILEDLFGEHPTGQVFENFNERMGSNISAGRSRYRSTAAVLGSAGPSIVLTEPSQADRSQSRKHTFYGHGASGTHKPNNGKSD